MRLALAVFAYNAYELVEKLRGADVPVMPVLTPNELPTNPHSSLRADVK
jgi:crotonobetainyl-CoA:carnitine CoA-transferase CaiB-like acyl-CoA transferase